jgi:hypothetical protein
MPKRKRKSSGGQVARTKKARTAEQYFARPKRQQDALLKTARVLTAMRNEMVSLHTAAAEHNVSPATVKRYAGPGLRKTSNGTFKARRSDTMLRVLNVPAEGGKIVEVAIRDSRTATIVGEHANAVHEFLSTGDSDSLAKFRRVSIIDAQGNTVPLLTDLDELERLGSAGVLSYQSLYARAA